MDSLSSHGAAALGAMCGIAQDPHPDKVTTGCALEPVAIHSNSVHEECHISVGIIISFHSMCLQFVLYEKDVFASFADVFPVLSVNRANRMGGKAAYGTGFLFHNVIPRH